MKIALAFLACWVVSGMCAAGWTNAYFQRRFEICDPLKGRLELSTNLGLGLLAGPIALVASAAFTGVGAYGWSLSRYAGCTNVTKAG